MKEHAVPTVQIDNERARVTRWHWAPGATSGFHRHEHDYIVVPLTSGTLEVTGPDGKTTRATLTAGEPYFRSAGVEHDVKNATSAELVFVEIELK